MDRARKEGLRSSGRSHPYVRKWRESSRSGDPIEVETRPSRADGEDRWFLARAVLLRGEAGRIPKRYEVITYIEDRKGGGSITR